MKPLGRDWPRLVNALDLAGLASVTQPKPWSQADHCRAAAVRSFLQNRVHTVVVWLEDTRSLGHQSATVEMIRRLARLGFTGTVELHLGGRENERKLRLLFPDAGVAAPNVGAGQCMDWQGLRLKFVSSAEGKVAAGLVRACCGAPQVTTGERRGRIVVLAADDQARQEGRQQGLCATLCCEGCLTLQPYQWPMPRSVYVWGRGLVPFKASPEVCFQYAVEDSFREAIEDFPNKLEQWIVARLPPARAAAARTLSSVVLAARQERLELAVVYGLHVPDTQLAASEVVQRFSEALRECGWGKPSVVLLVGDIPEWALQAVDARSCALVKLDQPDLPRRLGGLAESDVLVVRTGRLSKPVFSLCCWASTQPLLLEGANTANQALMMNKPYVSVFSKWVTFGPRTTGYPERFLSGGGVGGGRDPMVRRLDRISNGLGCHSGQGASALRDRASVGMLVRLLKNLKDPGSAPSLYFDDVSRLAQSPAHDQLTEGLDLLRRHLG